MNLLRRLGLKRTSHWSLQFASGLYADLGWRAAWSALTPGAGQHLALLGNCCSVATGAQRAETAEFLRRAAATWESVYIVPGPRELAAGGEGGAPFYKQLDELRALAQEVSTEWENVHIMDQGEVVIRNKDITVLGATGWTAAGADAEPIWKGEGQQISKEDIATWHNEDMAWLQERNTWWGMHHPEVRKVILTHHLCMESLVGGGGGGDGGGRPTVCMPLASVAPILGHLHPRAPYAWLGGAGAGAVSGMSRHTFLATNGLRAEEGGAVNRLYLPNRCMEIPLQRGPGPGQGSTAPALALA